MIAFFFLARNRGLYFVTNPASFVPFAGKRVKTNTTRGNLVYLIWHKPGLLQTIAE